MNFTFLISLTSLLNILSHYRQQSILTEEQAREVEAILSNNKELPPLPKEPEEEEEESPKRRRRSDDEPDWLQEVINGSANKSEFENSDVLNQTFIVESKENDSILSVESIKNSHVGSHHASISSLIEHDDAESEGESLQMEYPPQKSKEVFVNNDGVHFFEDGHFWMEVPGLLDNREEDEENNIPMKKSFKLRFSTDPIQVFSTFSINDYDRRNEDVDPVAASAEYELEKRVEKMDVFPVELMKGQEGLGLSIIGSKEEGLKLN